MPAVSKAQREAIAIAEHNPDKLYKRNRGLLKMDPEDMHDFAATPEKGLPQKVKKAPAVMKKPPQRRKSLKALFR
jgi:hypothetical protein